MVHTTTARAVDRVAVSQRLGSQTDSTLDEARPTIVRYVLVPDALITAFAHDPLAVGIYVAIARLAVIAKAGVPLAARDLALWMGSDRDADRAAIMRRIVKLEERGWLIISRTTAAKHILLPTWGQAQDGALRPWRFDTPNSGRPQHLRGRRVPIGMLDDYLGRLEPQPHAGRALISRYFTCPLLDLTDIGVYTIGLRVEVMPTPRLQHLDLYGEAGMLPLPDTQSLLAQVGAGTLIIDEGNAMVAVHLSVHGYARLGWPVPTTDKPAQVATMPSDGSLPGSANGSPDRAAKLSHIVDHKEISRAANVSTPLIAWDVGMIHEPTNHDSTPDHVLAHGGGAIIPDSSVREADAPSVPSSRPVDWQPHIVDTSKPVNLPPPDDVVEGHRALNLNRHILTGEWYELLALQEEHGTEQLLIWQARASRVTRERDYGIAPAYYRACAAQAAYDSYRPRSQHYENVRAAHQLPEHSTRASVWTDTRCESLLQTMGVRQRQKLCDVPYELIACWHEAVQHPGLAARFTSPLGFAVAQMRVGNAPPPIAELERWVEQAQRTNDRYELWRYIEPQASATEHTVDEQQLEARVRAIAPPNADLEDLCQLAAALEAGATDAQALAQLRTSAVGGVG